MDTLLMSILAKPRGARSVDAVGIYLECMGPAFHRCCPRQSFCNITRTSSMMSLLRFLNDSNLTFSATSEPLCWPQQHPQCDCTA